MVPASIPNPYYCPAVDGAGSKTREKRPPILYRVTDRLFCRRGQPAGMSSPSSHGPARTTHHPWAGHAIAATGSAWGELMMDAPAEEFIGPSRWPRRID